MAPQELTLDAEIFEEFRTILDSSIRALLRQMIEQQVKTGSITAKIEVDLARTVDDETGEIHYQPSLDPKVGIKLGKRANYGLRKLNGFSMRPDGNGGFIIGTKQMNIEDLYKGGASA